MRNILILIVTVAFFGSCQKVIDVDLNAADTKYVIQSFLYAGTHDFEVTIANTTSYFDPKTQVKIENATVVLYDFNNTAHTVSHDGNGVYKLINFTAEANKTYKLKVIISDQTFEAEVTVPELVTIESSEYIEEVETDGGEEITYRGIYIEFQDPEERKNYYLFDQRINSDESVKVGAEIENDFGTNGLLTGSFVTIDADFDSGDAISTELRSIDPKTYEYFRTLGDISGEDQDVTPANPITNWSNGALGFFGAANSDFSTVIVP